MKRKLINELFERCLSSVEPEVRAEVRANMKSVIRKKQTKSLKGVTIYSELPEGWKILEGTLTQPRGYRWCSNGKSIFSRDYQRALLRLS